MNTYPLEFKLFLRGSTAWIGTVVLLITGFAAIYFGKSMIGQQKVAIAKAASLQKKNTETNVEHFGNDTGLVFFHNKFSMANVPDQWASFSTGQRDINPYIISATMLALEGQIYDTEIANPVNLLFGNMDISFVFIFLFPLVIIAFNYNLLSELKESGIWTVLKTQSNNLFTVIWRKLVVRMITIASIVAILLLASLIILQLQANLKLVNAIIVLFLYQLFWFAVSYAVIALNKSSNYNASILITIWVCICIIAPAALNLYLSKQYPLPEALQNVINQREGYHEKWDMPKEVTMKPFFAHYPQLEKYPFPQDKSFSWFWYYGMQQMGDDQANVSKQAMSKKLNIRQHFTETAALFIPAIQTQLAINEICGTDLNTHIQFQNAYRKYHEEIRLHFYPAIFLEQDINQTNIKSIGLKKFIAQPTYGWHRLIPITVITFLIIGIATLKLKRTT